MDVRRAGLMAALAVGLLIITIVSVVVLTRSQSAVDPKRGVVSGSGATGTAVPDAPKPEPTPAPVLTGSGAAAGRSGGDLGTGGASTGKAQASFFRAEDPSRLAARLSWEKLEPAANGESTVTQPRGFVYLRDGSIARITAARGVFFTPKGRSEPESGRFEGDATTDGEGGGVTVEVFDPPTAPDGVIDFVKDSPGIVATTKSLVFNAPEAELSTQDPFTIETDKMSVVGTGALVVFDQVEEGISRAEFVKVQDIRIWPEGRPGLQGRGGSAVSTIAKQASMVQRAEDLAKGRRRLYRLSVEDDVALTQGPRRLLASRVEAWLTLINNRLPDGAVAKLGPEAVAGEAASTQTPTTDGTTRPSDGGGDLITAGWKGRMILVPVASMPEEFKGELVALRLTGGSSGPVRVLDEPARLAGEAPLVDYAATRRTLAMRATAGQRVVLSAGGIGTLVCSSLMANLPAGKIDIIGAGELDAAKADGSTALSATFADGLAMQFVTRNGWMTPAPISAIARGHVQAMAARAMASGQTAELTFAAVAEGEPVPTRASIRQIAISGNARAIGPAQIGRKGSAPGVREPADEVQGSRLTLTLEPDAAGTDTPRRVMVEGKARATTRGFVIEGDSFVADLSTDSDGRTIASNVVATGNPRVSDSTGLSAVAERITADPTSGTALLTGNPVSITRQGVTMNAAAVKLDQNRQTATVDGSGRIIASSNDGARTTTMEASWQNGATFDNQAARVDARGSIVAEINVGENESNLAKGDALVLLLAQTAGGATSSGTAGATAQDAVRQIRTIEIIGKDYTPGSGIAAQLQNRSYAGTGAARALARQIYLEGASILASSEAGTLTVPGAGKLLIDDRRGSGGAAATSNPLANLGTASGRSLFAWLGSLEMNRFTGRLAMRQQVALTHRPNGNSDEDQVLLDCNDLLATLRGLDASSLTDVKADLSRVEASGTVRAVTGGRAINADRLIYDALGEIITASGTEEQLVSFVDPAQQTPVRARNIEWNLREKRINTEGVAPIILTPR